MVEFSKKYSRLKHTWLSSWPVIVIVLLLVAAYGGYVATSTFYAPRASSSSKQSAATNVSEATSNTPAPAVVLNTAQEFAAQFATQQFASQWQELAPEAQLEWPSESARTAMLQAKFASAAVAEASVGNPVSGVTWTPPENPNVSVQSTWMFPVSVTFANPGVLRPAGVANLFSMTDLYVGYSANSGTASILGEGPSSMDAPIILPAQVPSRTSTVPIFMYHLVDQVPPVSIEPSVYSWRVEVGLTTLPSQFEQEMAYAHQAGATSISLQHLDDWLLYGLPLPPRPFVVTFDDGRLSQWANAVPVLRKYGFTAVFFPCTEFIGGRVGPQTYMTAAELQSLASGGFSIEDHTVNDGTALWNLTPAQLNPLTYQTMLQLQRLTGDPVQFIAYTGVWPWGTASGGGVQEAGMFSTFASYGYVGGLQDLRMNSDAETSGAPWQLPRVRVGLRMQQADFENWINGAYRSPT